MFSLLIAQWRTGSLKISTSADVQFSAQNHVKSKNMVTMSVDVRRGQIIFCYTEGRMVNLDRIASPRISPQLEYLLSTNLSNARILTTELYSALSHVDDVVSIVTSNVWVVSIFLPFPNAINIQEY